MIYKCEWCGNTESSPDYFYEEDTNYGKNICSYCGSDIHRSEKCFECEDYFSTECGDDFFHVEKEGGVCIACLKALCDVKTGIEYINNSLLLDDFIDFCVEGQEMPFIRLMLRRYIESGSENDEILAEKIWEYVCEDAEIFAEYVYNKSKGGDK